MASTRKNGRIAIILLAAILAGAGILAWVRISAKIEKSSRPATVSVITVGTMALKSDPIDQVLEFQGLAEGDPQVKVFPKVNGKLQNLTVREGDYVQAGQALLLINRDIAGADFQLAPVNAPFAGVVTRVYISDLGTELFPSQALVEIANPTRLKVALNVGESDLLKLAKGQTAEIWSTVDPSRRLVAWIDAVTPYVDRETLTGSVTVKAVNPTQVLKIGMSCGITIKTGVHQGFLVPEEAVILGLGQTSVFLYRDGAASQVAVKTGYPHAGLVEISGQLKVGDQLITDGAFKVYDKAVVHLAASAPATVQP